MSSKLRGISLFSSAGVAEFGFKNTNVDILLANELLPIRAKVHEFWHPKAHMICGSITNPNVKEELINEAKKLKIDFLFATPPCQGVSLIGKNKTNEEMLSDDRNYLIFDVFDVIDALKPKCILIENVARFFQIKYPYKGKLLDIKEIITRKYKKLYEMDFNVLDAKDYGIPQHRERAIIKLWKKGYQWKLPKKEKIVTVREAIGDLPSLEAGEKSNIKNHYARNHTKQHVLLMKHTPTGHSAFENEVYYPKNLKTGERLKGYASTYKRIEWDDVAPTITMRNDCISSQSNVHPGRLLKDGTYSDARALTIRELFILSSINPDLDIPNFVSDIQLRQIIGEGVPPKLIHVIIKGLKNG